MQNFLQLMMSGDSTSCDLSDLGMLTTKSPPESTLKPVYFWSLVSPILKLFVLIDNFLMLVYLNYPLATLHYENMSSSQIAHLCVFSLAGKAYRNWLSSSSSLTFFFFFFLSSRVSSSPTFLKGHNLSFVSSAH